MDYKKIDAALAGTLKDADDPRERCFILVIKTFRVLNHDEANILKALGAKGDANDQLFTATLSMNEIDKLSEYDWIQSIRLSRKLHFSGYD